MALTARTMSSPLHREMHRGPGTEVVPGADYGQLGFGFQKGPPDLAADHGVGGLQVGPQEHDQVRTGHLREGGLLEFGTGLFQGRGHTAAIVAVQTVQTPAFSLSTTSSLKPASWSSGRALET